MIWLEEKYARYVGSQLQLFKHLRGSVYTFRCPFCGDSDKDKTKTRGYFYPNKGHLKFKCHNCGAGMSFYTFLQEKDPSLFKDYKLELFKERRQERAVAAPKKVFKHKHRKPQASVDFMGLTPLSKLSDTHIAVKYVKSRRLPDIALKRLYYVDQMADIAHRLNEYKETHFDRFPRLIIPFIDADGITTHVQGRAIGSDVPKGSRYVTLELVEECPKVYGMDRIDTKTDVLVVEGPFDSMFLPNCAAMGGADLTPGLFDPKTTTFILDNEKRNREIIKRMSNLAACGYGVCVWGGGVTCNDINDMVLSGTSINDIVQHIHAHTFRGLRAKLEIKQFKRI